MKYYLTTPLYYVNDIPHIGHAYTTIAADVLARWQRLKGAEVFFLTGTDEHGMKIAAAAKEKGREPLVYVDKMAAHFVETWKKLNISNDDFIRTTQERHRQTVQMIFKQLLKSDDLYQGDYEGWYCLPCETFWTEFQLGNSQNCPDCGRPVDKLKEAAYFFKLSRYQDQIKAHFEKQPDFVQPESRKNEVLSFLKEPLKDLCITRRNFTWGVPVPDEGGMVIYVWFDALINYISALGYPENKNFKRFWPADVHLIGKEIIRFHAVIWPALLLALKLPLPQKIFAHGWWTLEGEKMSKSKGNVVDPLELCQKYGVDAFRYFILREIHFGADGDFSLKSLIQRFNSDLANDLGNLLNRSLTMLNKYFDGVVPQVSKLSFIQLDEELIALGKAVPGQVENKIEKLAFSDALAEIWKLINKANFYIEKRAPWNLAKANNQPELKALLYNLCEVLRLVSVLISPFMPATSQKMSDQLGFFDPSLEWGRLRAGTQINKGDPLFPRI